MTAAGSQLSINAPSPGLLVLDGEIDAQTAPQLGEVVAAFPQGYDAGLVIDMASVTFMDSSGLRILVDLNRRALDSGVSLELRSPSRRVARVIEISGLSDVLVVQSG